MNDVLAWAAAGGFIVVWIAIAAVTGWLAGRKHRDSGLWFLLAVLTGPFALIALFLVKTVPRQD